MAAGPGRGHQPAGRALLTRADRDTLLNEVFDRAGTEATVFEANKQALLQAIGTTGLRIAIDLRSGTEMEGAIGAYALVGLNGHEIIDINADWINAGNLSLEQLTAVVLEEYGHALDARLNPGLESVGDEGELFANLLLGDELSAEERAAITEEDDSATLSIDGVQVAVEAATFTGDANANTRTGADGNDDLSGLAGADSLSGGACHDRLQGGADAETMTPALRGRRPSVPEALEREEGEVSGDAPDLQGPAVVPPLRGRLRLRDEGPHRRQ
jgi:Ca2+-binding RTX toxin-like protein